MTIHHSSVDTKENNMFKVRRSSRSVGRKVRFEGKKDQIYMEVPCDIVWKLLWYLMY
jgi:hypothetical protein